MKLKTLEIHGFKSFSDRVSFSFPSGITTIVGPNGCGKSNILDAILWALGEKNARHLRGKVMEDVIFGGADQAKPLGMAEVNLILANDDGGCPEKYKSFEEIMVSRRLFRSGESEYLINNAPCRLRDVVDLFLDMGMGHQAYSLVEQGKIEAIINAKPEERRIFIEEAAGIAKFRERRREALLKMDHTEQNLLRIQDVVAEIRRQIHSLERQVKKAERFKRLRKEIREGELLQAYTEYSRLGEEQNQSEAVLGGLKGDEASLSAQIQEREKTITALKTQCAEWEERIKSSERTVYEIRAHIDREQGRIEAGDREVANLKRLDTQYGTEIDELNAKVRAAKNHRAVLQDELTELGRRIIEKEKELGEKSNKWQALHERYDEATRSLEDHKADLVELLSQQSERTNQISFCDRTLTELGARKQRNKQEMEETEKNLKSNRSHLGEKETARESLEKKNRTCEEETEALRQDVESQEGDLNQEESSLRDADHQHQLVWSKLQSLEELNRSFEGYDEGVKTVMRSRGSELRGIRGLVADIIETEPRYQAALGAVLDHRLQYLIVQSHKDGIDAIELLKKQGTGRIGLIPMNLKREENRLSATLKARNGVIGPLLNHVKLKSGYKDLGDLLLGNTWLIESLNQAIDVWLNDNSFHSLVTLGGEVIDAAGIIIGGSGKGQAFEILDRRNRITSLTAKAAQSQSKLDRMLADLKEKKEKLTQLRLDLDAKVTEKQALAMDLVALERDIEKHAREVDEDEKRREVLSFERNQIDSQISDIESERLTATQHLERLESEVRKKRETIQKAQATLNEAERQRGVMDEEMTQVKVKIAEWQEQRKGSQRSLDSLEDQEKDLREQISKRLEMLEGNRKAIQKTEQDITELHGQVKDWKQKQEEAKKQISQEKQGLQAKSNDLKKLEDLSRGDQTRVEDLRKKIHDNNLKLAETHLNMNHVVESIDERYRIDIRVSPIPEEIRTREVPEPDELTRLKSSLDSLGEVNLVALQEYEDLKERLDFLVNQQEDLKASLARLRKAIQRIDRTTKKRFIKAFEGANEKFQTLFPRLFNGGKAALVMTDEEDILNTGIEILAQLPGKRLRRLDLLSGGEKALVAIALIFSFFLYRPTPFCLLDEVDAPLDDANVAKFLEMVQELSDRSQLILITHNKKTMEVAQTLYGITMESPGISKVVSVKLNESSPPQSPPNS